MQTVQLSALQTASVHLVAQRLVEHDASVAAAGLRRVERTVGADEQVGHIVHLNLRPEQLPHRFVIGQVLLDKLRPRIRTVVNKADEIRSEFRTLPLERELRLQLRQTRHVHLRLPRRRLLQLRPKASSL